MQSGTSAHRYDRRRLTDVFLKVYGTALAGVFRAPGRVNLIGEHTDYNEGFVMPAALDMSTYVAVAPRSDRLLRAYSMNFEESFEISLDANNPGASGTWGDYVRGVAGILEIRGHRLPGADLVILGEVPLGAGLSSSAAIEVATAVALLSTAGIKLERTEIAMICQQAEHLYAGTRCGIMDQFIACHGKKGRAVMLDCRSLDFRLLPLPEKLQLVICNSMVKHELASSEYNTRRAQCEAGVRVLKTVLPEIASLRDVTEMQLNHHRNLLEPVVYRRCRHVVTENDRVQRAGNALQDGDVPEVGHLMYESHRSLRDDYEVSCPELDILVESARPLTGVYASRMTGGGFGGCTINLVEMEHVQNFQREIARTYQQKTGMLPQIFVCQASEGAEAVTI